MLLLISLQTLHSLSSASVPIEDGGKRRFFIGRRFTQTCQERTKKCVNAIDCFFGTKSVEAIANL